MKTNNCNSNCDTDCSEMSCPLPCSQGINRRDFLKVALATGLLAGCGPLVGCSPNPEPTPTAAPTSEPTGAPTSVPTATPQALPVRWPTENWATSTPEAQGMDSEQLARLLEHIEQNVDFLHSLLITRNGHIVTEAYFYPFEQDTEHVSLCASRSVLSAAVGIAIAKGLVESADQPILDLFAGRMVANRDAYKEALAVKHVLISRAGLAWDQGTYLDEFVESDDQIQFLLDQPMVNEPGSPNASGSAGPYLLSAILQETTQHRALDFVQTNLFEPLGISDPLWHTEASGMLDPFGLYLTTRDLARFGYLYLNDGVWEGQRILPAGWVAASTTEYTRLGCDAGMGYSWWLPRNMSVYCTRGLVRVFVAPELDMVFVLTSGASNNVVMEDLAEGFMRAADSPAPLPENSEMTAQLDSLSKAVEQPPEPEPVPPFSDLAQLISGKTYALEDNPYNWQTFTLSFQDQEAQITFSSDDGAETLAIGLDGIYRIGKAPMLEAFPTAIAGESFALRGSWRTSKSFRLNLQLLSGRPVDIDFAFEEDGTAAKMICPGLRFQRVTIKAALQG